jgi:acetyltransferase-like isoleucine patch superfamily enzyme
MYLEGSTLADLMRLTGLSQRQVTKRLVDEGISLRPSGHMRGKSHPEEVRLKISAAKKGIKKPPFSEEWRVNLRIARRGRTPAKGMKHSAEARQKMSEKRKGEKNGRWIDGRKQTPYPPEWTKELRRSVKERQERKCGLCGAGDLRLHVHHINWDKLNCATSNLIALCAKCHGLAHRKKYRGFYELLLMHTARGIDIAAYPPMIVLRPENIVIGSGARLDSMIKLEGGLGVSIGAFVHIGSFVSVNIGGGRLLIGEHAGIGSGARLLGGSNMPGTLSMSAASPPELQHVVRKTTSIGAYAFVASNAVVLPGVTIGEGAVLGAGGVATKDIPPWQVWGGVPAHYIKDRPRPVPDGAPELPSEGW